MSAWFFIEDVDENYAPPEKPVLRVAVVVGERNEPLLSIAICEAKNAPGGEFKELAQTIVPYEPVAHAVRAALLDEAWRVAKASKSEPPTASGVKHG